MDFRNTKVFVGNIEQSKQFQELVFAAGGRWRGGDQVVSCVSYPYLFVGENLDLTFSNNYMRYQNNPNRDVTQEFFTTKPTFEVGDQIRSKQHSRIATVLFRGKQVAVIQHNEYGSEYALSVAEVELRWEPFSPFDDLDIDDPVWVRNHSSEEWKSRHYANFNSTWHGGETSHTAQDGNVKRWKFWKHETLGEWEDTK